MTFEKLAEGEFGGQKGSEVRPQGGQVYNYKALQRLAGEPAVLNSELTWEPIFLYDCNLYVCLTHSLKTTIL